MLMSSDRGSRAFVRGKIERYCTGYGPAFPLSIENSEHFMGYAICVTNIKGGCGKTTTAVNLSTALAIAEKKVLLVDCDPQGHATSSMGINKAALNCGL